mmetsp:Transcript_11780/g.33338  ORF Transcript_11780/g.33338 Transcript_11780/m.33338 type:complete len:281 (+) Transcript_11780:126-968(+)
MAATSSGPSAPRRGSAGAEELALSCAEGADEEACGLTNNALDSGKPPVAPPQSLSLPDAKEEAHMARARALYDANIAMLLRPIRVNKRGTYRVRMDGNGLILEVRHVRSCPPRPDCFALVVPGGDSPPRIGNLSQLRGPQLAVATNLKNDIDKVLRANELAYILDSYKDAPGSSECGTLDEAGGKAQIASESAATDDGEQLAAKCKLAQAQVDEYRARFGELNEPIHKRKTEEEDRARLAKEARKKEIELARQEILEEPEIDFAALLSKEIDDFNLSGGK